MKKNKSKKRQDLKVKTIPLEKILKEGDNYYLVGKENEETKEREYFSIPANICIGKVKGDYLTLAEIVCELGCACVGASAPVFAPSGNKAQSDCAKRNYDSQQVPPEIIYSLHVKTETGEDVTIPGAVRVDEKDEQLMTALFVAALDEDEVGTE